MIRRLPLLPSLVVLVAVAVMLRLGFWQLDRMREKNALIARYAAAADAPMARLGHLPTDGALLYRKAEINCLRVLAWRQMAGDNARGESGIAHVATCETGGAPTAPSAGDGGARGDIVIGWSRDLRKPTWSGGLATGVLAPGAGGAARLVADPPLAGLEANARPDPAAVPNNHLSYAVQWFLFAGAALLIYVLAVRKRLAASAPPG